MIRRLSDGALIPKDLANADYAAFMKWKSEGGIEEEADPPPAPTQEELDRLYAKADIKLSALASMSPSQIRTWVDNNVSNLNQAKDVLATTCIAVSLLARSL